MCGLYPHLSGVPDVACPPTGTGLLPPECRCVGNTLADHVELVELRNQLVERPMLAPRGSLDGYSKGGIADKDAELDVAILGRETEQHWVSAQPRA